MTEHYWQRYKKQLLSDPYYSDDTFWKNVRNDLKRREKVQQLFKQQPKHHLELYSYCKSDNPFIRQIKASPNITVDTVSEMICRDNACELQYCMSLQKIAESNRRSKIDLQGCEDQYQTMSSCLKNEKQRILQKEMELRDRVYGIQRENAIDLTLKDKNLKQIKRLSNEIQI